MGAAETRSEGGVANDGTCDPATPVRYAVANPEDPLGPNIHDACETMPPACKTLDGGSICGCLSALKMGADGGTSSCPGNGPVYCSVESDGTTYLLRCAPP
jgi:hypothetical protein